MYSTKFEPQFRKFREDLMRGRGFYDRSQLLSEQGQSGDLPKHDSDELSSVVDDFTQ